MLASTESTLRQDGGQEVLVFIQAVRDGKMPDAVPEMFKNECETLLDVAGTTKEQIEETLKNIRGMRQSQAFDDLLKQQDDKSDEKTVGTSDYPPLPAEARLQPYEANGACTWLDGYVEFSKQCSPESYKHFHVFCGVMVLVAIAARRVYIPSGIKKIYTNLYLMLASESTVFAKSEAMNVAKYVLGKIGLASLSFTGDITTQKLISTMSGVVDKSYGNATTEEQERKEREIVWCSQKCLFYDEYGKFLKGIFQENSFRQDMQKLLLEAYDSDNELRGSTVSRGDEIVERPYLSVLGLAVPSTLNKVLGKEAEGWKDGLLARTSVICAEGQPIVKTRDLVEIPVPPDLQEVLTKWHKWLGIPKSHIAEKENKTGATVYVREEDLTLFEHKCAISEEAKVARIKYREAIKRLTHNAAFPKELSSNYGRLDVMSLKIAMLFASLDACQVGKNVAETEINLAHWAKAQQLTELLRQSLHEFHAQVTGQQRTSKASREDAIIAAMKHYAGKQKDKKDIPVTIAVLKNRSRPLQGYSCEEIESTAKSLVNSGIFGCAHTSKTTKYFLKPEKK